MCRYRRPERRSTHRHSDRGSHVNSDPDANFSSGHGRRFGNRHSEARPDRGSCDCNEHANPDSACGCHSHTRHHPNDEANGRACGNRNACTDRNTLANCNT
jgi:hypothetical protein